MSRFVVLGGGISALAAARFLAGGERVTDPSPAGAPRSRPEGGAGEVILLEASHRLGGKVLTGSTSGGPVELGPDQFLRRDPSAERLCRLLGLGPDLVPPGASSAAVLAGGRPRPLPAGLVLGIPTDLGALASSGIVSAEAVEFARGDARRPGRELEAADVGLGAPTQVPSLDPERSAGAILRPRLGDEIVERLVDPLIGGINAASVDGLSLGTVAPQVAQALVGHRDVIGPLARLASPPATAESPFLGLVGGLGRLVASLGDELHRLGCTVRLGCPALSIREAGGGRGYLVGTPEGDVAADGIVLALPAAPAAAALELLAAGAAELLGEVAYSSVAVVTFALADQVPAGLGGLTGVLVPRAAGTLMTALTLLTQKWPWMSGALVRVSAGRSGDDRIAGLTDAELCEALAAELETATGLTVQAPATGGLVQRWHEALPQYAPGHAARMAAVRQALEGDGRHAIALAGAVLGGVGIPACITSGERAAEAVRAALAAPA